MRVSEKDKRFGGSAVLYKQHFASAKMYFSALHVVEDLSKGAINSNRARKKLGAMVGYYQNLTRFAVTDSYLGLLFEQLMILQDQRVESI